MSAELATAYITILPSLRGASKELEGQLGGINTSGVGKSIGSKLGAGVGSGLSSAKVAIGNILANVAMGGINAIRGSMDSAISRVDTLNQFPRVMSNIGFTAEEAQASIKKLGDGIDGLPTTLDGIVAQTQQFAMTLGDLDLATNVAIAANDGLVTFGASAEGASRAVVQLNQMIATGKYDMQSWNSVNSVAPGMLDAIAKAMLGEGASAGQLREALNSGKISTADFLNALVDLDQNGTDSITAFSKTAKDATGGIATSMANVKTAVTKNLANIINAFNGENGNFTKLFDSMKLAINGLGKAILPVAEVFGNVFGNVVGMATPYLEAFSKRCETFATTFRAVFQDSGNILESFAWGLKNAFVNTPFEQPLSVLAQGVQAFFDSINAGGSVLDGFKSAIGVLPDSLREIKDVLSGVIGFLEPAFSAIEAMGGRFRDTFKSTFDETHNAIQAFASGLSSAFSDTPLQGVFDTLSNMVQAFCNTLQDGGTYVEAFKSAIDQIPGPVLAAATVIGGTLAGAFAGIKIAQFGSDALNAGKHLFTLAEDATKAASQIPLLGSAFGSANSALTGFHGNVTKAGGGLGGLATTIGGTARSAFSGFSTMVTNAGGGVRGFVGAIGTIIGPVGIVIAAIGALVGIFALLYNTNEEFRNSMNALGAELISQLQPAFQQIMDAFSQMASTIVPPLISAITALVPVIVQIATTISSLIAAVLPVIANILMAILVPAITMIVSIISVLAPIIAEIITQIIGVATAILEVVIPVVEAIMEVISAVMPVIVALIQTGMEVIKAVIDAVWPVIQAIIETTMNVIQGVIDVVMAAIQGNWDGVWTAIGNLCNTIWNGIGNIVSTIISTVQSVISSALSTIQGIWDSCWNTVRDLLQSAWDAMCTAVSNAISNIVTWIGELPGKITGFFANAGTWLINAGKQILQGLWDGMKSIWDSVTGWLGGLGDIIMSIKGPEQYDKKLLIPAGKWIMGGLEYGLKTGFEDVKSTLTDATEHIAGMNSVYYDAGSAIAQAIGDGMADQTSNLANTTANLLNKGIGDSLDNLDIGGLTEKANSALGDIITNGAMAGIGKAADAMDRNMGQMMNSTFGGHAVHYGNWANPVVPNNTTNKSATYQTDTHIYATVNSPQDWNKVATRLTSRQERQYKAWGLR